MTKTEYLNKLRIDNYKWCNDGQWECCKMVFDLIGGHHHLTAKIKQFGTGIEYNTFKSLSTYDFATLTNAVIMAHERLIRFEIRPSGPGLLKWCLSKRKTRENGKVFERHPTLDQAIKHYKEYIK